MSNRLLTRSQFRCEYLAGGWSPWVETVRVEIGPSTIRLDLADGGVAFVPTTRAIEIRPMEPEKYGPLRVSTEGGFWTLMPVLNAGGARLHMCELVECGALQYVAAEFADDPWALDCKASAHGPKGKRARLVRVWREIELPA